MRVLAEKNKAMDWKQPVYAYVFNPEIPGWDNPGTFHSVDLWFFFENIAKCWRPFTGKHYDLARQMCNALCYFCKNGDPNGVDNNGLPMPQWKPFTLDDQNVMYWGDTPVPYVEPANKLKDFLTEQNVKDFE